jgi:N-hydroxyarylamine O-acetyltransferase
VADAADACERYAWLARIAYRGPRAATLEALRGLVFAHSHAIANESLDIMLGREPRLGVADLQRKMIDRKRGGYCFGS